MKPGAKTATWTTLFIREQDPLKQGLKLAPGDVFEVKIGIREQDPLKQGLKLFNRTRKTLTELIREQDPLKQGLKQCYYL